MGINKEDTMDKEMQDFLALFGDDLLEESIKKSVKIEIKEKMAISTYNKKIQQQTKREIPFNISYVIKEKDKAKMQNTGWKLFDVDVKAIKDFMYSRVEDPSHNRNIKMQNVLMYALRHYIPKEIYDDIINRSMDMRKGVIEISDKKVKEFKEYFTDLNRYHSMINYNSVYNSNELNHITCKPSWRIPYMDYLAVVDFEKIFQLSYQNIVTNALRFYLLKQNYNHAEEVIRLTEKHKEENIEMYRGEINQKSK